MAPIINFGADLLTGWYQSQAASSTLSTLPRSTLSTAAPIEKSTPPWDVESKPPTFDERLRKALSGGKFVDFTDPFFSKDIPEDQKELFALYKALNKLQALATHAVDKTTFSGLLPGLDKRFDTGLTEISGYIEKLDLESFLLSTGVVERKVDGKISIPRPSSDYVGRIAQNGAFDAAIPGLTGTEVFTVTSDKFGVKTNVVIDLSAVGGTLNIDNIVSYINTQLSAAGVLSQFKRTRIYDQVKDEDGNLVEPSPLPSTFGFKIEGVSTETLSITPATGTPAIYIGNNSGNTDSISSQFIKLTDVASGSPTLVGGNRVAPEGDEARAAESVIDSQGNIYIVGQTTGDIDSLITRGTSDVYITKQDATGRILWTRTLGASQSAEGFSIAVDSSDNIVIAGAVTGDLESASVGNGLDSFVTKYDSDGQEIFTRQIAPYVDDAAFDVAVAADGSIFLAGYTEASIGTGGTYQGGKDAYVTKLDSSGVLVYNRQFGTTGDDTADAISVDASGDVVVASVENGTAFVRKYSGADGVSAAIWEQNLGSIGTTFGGSISSLVIDGTSIYVGGATNNTSLGSGAIGDAHTTFGLDGFVTKITDSGVSSVTDFTTYVGTGSLDRVHDISVSAGKLYVSGEVRGALGANPFVGTVNGFAAEIDTTTGVRQWDYQYSGSEGVAVAKTLIVDDQGSSVLDILGLPKGEIGVNQSRTVTARTSVRADDYFYVSVDNGAKRKVTIETDDTLRSLTFKINRVLLLDGKASVRRTLKGDTLHIEANEGVRVNLFAGPDEKNALEALGLKEGTVYDDGSLLGDGDEKDFGPPVFGLGLDTASLSLENETVAKFALGAINDALSEIRRIFREITKDPALDDLLKNGNKAGGPVPAYLTAQLANYQAGLARLSSGPPASNIIL